MSRKEQILKLLKDSPDDIFLQYALAMEYISVDEIDEAINVLLEIRHKNPDYLPLYYQLAKLFESKDQAEYAIEAYEAGMIIADKQNERKTYMELRSALEELTF